MAQRDKTTLKTYFEAGDIPTQAQFADLIDSNLNAIDDLLDEDDFASDSATKVPSQQSAKKYVDDKASLLTNQTNRISKYSEQSSEGVFENIDISEYRSYKTPEAINAVVTGIVGGDELVHPKVIHIPCGFNGYIYWMAITPYPNSDSDFENPSILASNNLTDWVEPTGLTNPISPQPSNGFYADPDLFYDPIEERLICIWKGSNTPEAITAGVTDVLYYSESTDGVTWTDKTMFLTVAAGFREVDPVMIYLDGQYWFFTMIYEEPNTTQTSISIRKSDTILDFQNSTPETAVVNTPDSSRPWHPDIIRIGNRFIMVTDTDGSSQTDLYIAESYDGLNWNFNNTALLATGGSAVNSFHNAFYKSSIIKGFDDVLAHLIYGAKGTDGWQLGYNTIKKADDFFSFEDRNNRLSRLKNGAENILAHDSFWRADGALGNLDSGQAWTIAGGSATIENKKLRSTSTGNTRVIVDVGSSDFFFTSTIEKSGTEQAYLNFRWQDFVNRWRFGINEFDFTLQKIVAGSLTTVYQDSVPQYDTFNLGVRCQGNTITIYLNNQPIHSLEDATFNTETSVGWQLFGQTQRIVDIIVE